MKSHFGIATGRLSLRIWGVADDTVTLTLSKAAALVLFETLADSHQQQRIEIPDQATRAALWNLSSVLEKTLIEMFSPEYKGLLLQAREQLNAGQR